MIGLEGDSGSRFGTFGDRAHSFLLFSIHAENVNLIINAKSKYQRGGKKWKQEFKLAVDHLLLCVTVMNVHHIQAIVKRAETKFSSEPLALCFSMFTLVLRRTGSDAFCITTEETAVVHFSFSFLNKFLTG